MCILSRKQQASTMLDHMEQALSDAIRVAEDTNSRVSNTLASLEDPARHQSIVEQVRDEAAANPGFLEEVEKLLLTCRTEDLSKKRHPGSNS